MARSCSPPKSVGVRDYFRSRPRRKAVRAQTTYWECYNGNHGCGVHHRDKSTALRHSTRLQKDARRRGQRGADWFPRKVG